MDIALLRRLVCQTVTVAIPGFAMGGKAPIPVLSKLSFNASGFGYAEPSQTPVPGSDGQFCNHIDDSSVFFRPPLNNSGFFLGS